jgi:hypothetical protein
LQLQVRIVQVLQEQQQQGPTQGWTLLRFQSTPGAHALMISRRTSPEREHCRLPWGLLLCVLAPVLMVWGTSGAQLPLAAQDPLLLLLLLLALTATARLPAPRLLVMV